MRDKDEQLWDYEAAISTGIFRNKTGFVADMNTRTNEVTMTKFFMSGSSSICKFHNAFLTQDVDDEEDVRANER